jgi:phosphohistidine phosphatase
MRHADAAAAPDDQARQLTRQGNLDAREMGQRLAKGGYEFVRIVASTAVRARETAALASEALQAPVETQFDDRLYLAASHTIQEVVAETSAEIESLLIVGHNPGISEALEEYVPGSGTGMPTAAVAVIEFDTPGWEETQQQTGRLLIFDYPQNRNITRL